MQSAHALLLAITISSPALAQSFDCKLAKSPREHAICSNENLSALDTNIAAAYKAARSKLSPAAFALVQSDQRHWLRWLDKVCPSNSDIAYCLTEHYNSRLQQLSSGVVTTNGITFYPRAQYGFALDTRKPQPGDLPGPDFSSDENVWPQIDIRPDRPNPAYAAWNATFHPDPPTKAPTSDEDINMKDFSTYAVIAANDRLINISFSGWFDSGGVHPQLDSSGNLWWLDKHRALIAADIFRPDSGWQQKLVDPAIQKLKADYPDDVDPDDVLREVVPSAITRVSAWGITSKGFTITFNQKEVGSYSIDTPDIAFTWDELKPYLAPTLNPSTLPAPISKPNP